MNQRRLKFSRSESAQIFPLAALLIGLAITVVWSLVGLGTKSTDIIGAEAVADQAALAGHVGGREAALQVAQANDVQLLSFEIHPGGTAGETKVVVEIQKGSQTASAKFG